MYRNLDACEAAPGDVVKNGQFGVQNTIDMAAVQQLLFQAVVLIAYIAAVGRLMVETANSVRIDTLPGLPSELLALLGVSVAAQVGNAAIPKARAVSPAPRPIEGFWLEGPDSSLQRLEAEKPGVESGGLPIGKGVLSAPEWALFKQDPIVGAFVLLHAKGAMDEAMGRYKAVALEDDNGDAFRHAYWNARMAGDPKVGPAWAEKWATAHEDGTPGNPLLRRQMDLFNNAVGRKNASGASANLAQTIAKCVDAGQCRVLRAGVLMASDDKFKL